jgi:hypothetical protein
MLLRFSFVHNYHGDNGIAVCYVLFRFAITKWNLRTPGREPDTEFEAHEDANLSDAQEISQFGRRGLRPIVFVLNNSGYLSERLLCKDMAITYNDIAAWNDAELTHALGCQGWFTARVSTCGELDDALKTAEQADGAA